jgi:ABC-type polysaccharide/polyol phosphate transport system ATPase subunit
MSMIRSSSLWEKYRIKFIEAGKVSWEEIWALQDINLDVKQGEVVGIIGQNGAGKTTILRLIAGMLVPDKGGLEVNGKVAAIMELGAGLNPEFTGKENILLNARIYGISEERLEEKIDEIVEFSGLGKFINAPIKYYSQGMYMRLAFALAIFAEPDILLIDDILAVGDQEAQGKCLKKINDLKEAGKTIIIVSHDMGLINRLCDKVFLFEKGRVIKQGAPQEIIPYYLETSGEKQGMAVLENGPLRVVFNNGRLSISHSGRQLTGALGLAVSFIDPLLKLRSCSTNLSWKINSRSDIELSCEGFCLQENANSQKWQIKLTDQSLDISISNNFPLLKFATMDFFISPVYTEWRLFESEGNFPVFSDKVNWFDLNVQLPSEQALGLFSKTDAQLPGLIIHTRGQASAMKLFNSGYSQESRVLQVAQGNEELSLKVNFCQRISDFNTYFSSEKEKLILARKKQEEEKALKEKLAIEEKLKKEDEEKRSYLDQHTITGQEARCFVDIDNRRLRFYYKDNELTAAGGINSIFLLKDLYQCCWSTRKVSENQIILTLAFVGLTQIWDIRLEEENTISLNISGETKTDLPLDNRFLRLELRPEYTLWQTSSESGDFLKAQYTQEIAPVRLKNNRVSCLAALSKIKHLPAISFEVTTNQDKYVAGIFKQRSADEEITCLSFYAIIPWAETIIPKGKHDIFSARISFGSSEKLQENILPDTYAILCSDDTELYFDRGRGKIYHLSKEITSGLGVYTAMRSKNIWYDSFQAVWSMVKKNNKLISFCGKWPYIPVSQIWQIEIIGPGQWRWTVNMQIHKETSIELAQAGIMLTAGFSEWSAGKGSKGKFLDDFTSDYDILPFRHWYGKAKENILAISGNSLPDLSFSNTTPETMPRGLVENSDYIYCSRLLQYQKNNNQVLPAGKYPYFSGVIKVGNKE